MLSSKFVKVLQERGVAYVESKFDCVSRGLSENGSVTVLYPEIGRAQRSLYLRLCF